MIIILNKPYGILSQFNKNPDYPEQKTLAELGLPPETMPVGRLDLDSEGLLLLTDEKGFEETLIHPKHGHRRTYLVQVDGIPKHSIIEMLRSGGIEIRGHRTKKCRASLLKETPKVLERVPPVDVVQADRSAWLSMELTEGKNRQVRRMTAKVGFPTLRLIRQKIGNFEAADLKLGEWRVISESERAQLFES
jgi:23S rRNA pseudouridine2457 synthase